MKKLSKVKTVQGNGTWDSKYGLLYKFEYLMEDGQVIHANHKTQDGAFNVGETVEYEITNAQYNNGKVSKPQENDFKGGKKDDSYVKGIEVGHAINNAVNLICAGVDLEFSKSFPTNDEKIYEYAKRIMQISERLKNE